MYLPHSFLIVRAGRAVRVVRVVSDDGGETLVATRFVARRHRWSLPYRVARGDIVRTAQHDDLRSMRPAL